MEVIALLIAIISLMVACEKNNNIEKYTDFIIKKHEEICEEKSELERQNVRLREQVKFFERELSTEETEKGK